MFTINSDITDVKIREKNLIKAFFSMNKHQVATPEMMLEEARSYILFFREADGRISSYIALHLLVTGRKMFYAHSTNTFSEKDMESVSQEALEFVEGLGALIDEIDFANSSPEEKRSWIDKQDIFSLKAGEEKSPDQQPSGPAPEPEPAAQAQDQSVEQALQQTFAAPAPPQTAQPSYFDPQTQQAAPAPAPSQVQPVQPVPPQPVAQAPQQTYTAPVPPTPQPAQPSYYAPQPQQQTAPAAYPAPTQPASPATPPTAPDMQQGQPASPVYNHPQQTQPQGYVPQPVPVQPLQQTPAPQQQAAPADQQQALQRPQALHTAPQPEASGQEVVFSPEVVVQEERMEQGNHAYQRPENSDAQKAIPGAGKKTGARPGGARSAAGASSDKRKQDILQTAIQAGIVKPPKTSLKKESRSAAGVVSRDRESLARLLTSF